MTIFSRRRQQKLLYVLAVPETGRTAGMVKVCILKRGTVFFRIPQEPVMGIEPMTPVLPRLCATAAPHGQVFFGWAVRDSNPRSRQTADLQSAPFGHFGNCPG